MYRMSNILEENFEDEDLEEEKKELSHEEEQVKT